MGWRPTGVQTGSSDNTLDNYAPILSMILHDPSLLGVPFSETKFAIMDSNKNGVLLQELVVKNWSYISADVHLSFTKTDIRLSRLAHVGEDSWVIIGTRSAFDNITQFLVKLWSTISGRSRGGAIFFLSSRKRGGNIRIRILVKCQQKTRKAFEFLNSVFRLLNDTMTSGGFLIAIRNNSLDDNK